MERLHSRSSRRIGARVGFSQGRAGPCAGWLTMQAQRSSSVALRSRRLEGGAPLIFFRRSMCSLPRLANRRLRGGGAGACLKGQLRDGAAARAHDGHVTAVSLAGYVLHNSTCHCTM